MKLGDEERHDLSPLGQQELSAGRLAWLLCEE